MPPEASSHARLVRSQQAAWRRLELPTWGLAAFIYAGWLALTWYHAALPWWMLPAMGGWIVTWHMSLQHEVVHGHPTRDRRVNAVIGFTPLSLWLPFARYRESHLAHHRNATLTHPLEDPESFYLTRMRWDGLPAARRLLLSFHNTLAGRILIGPFLAVAWFLWEETNSFRRGPVSSLRVWVPHVAGAACVLCWTVIVCGMPVSTYLACFVYPGLGLTLIRSFAEHRAARESAHRTAIVEKAPVLGLLYLYNNLHVAHHVAPGLPWFDLPAFYRANREALLRANGGLVYRGYGDVARRYFFTRHDSIAHPFDRPVPARMQAASGGQKI
jgi:fatty acid desaturase